MASFSTSTDDGNFQFHLTEPNIYISENEQISGNNREDSVYEESANFRQDEQISGSNRDDIAYDESANTEQDEQVSGSKYVYEEPAITQRSGGRKEDKELQPNNWHVKCFMAMMIALVIAVVVLTVSTISNYGINLGINQDV